MTTLFLMLAGMIFAVFVLEGKKRFRALDQSIDNDDLSSEEYEKRTNKIVYVLTFTMLSYVLSPILIAMAIFGWFGLLLIIPVALYFNKAAQAITGDPTF